MRRFSVRLVNKLVTQTTSTLCFSTVGNGTFEKNLVKELGLTDTDHVCKLLRVLSEKDTEVLNEKHKSHIKDITQDFAIKTMQTELTFLTEKFLRAEGTMTARGIFEHTFEIFHLAAGLKGRFNVAGSLHHAEWLLNERLEHPQKSAALHPRVSRVLEVIEDSNFPGSALAPLYQRLSKDLHGRPWHGASVLLVLDDFNEAEQRLLQAIAAERGLSIEAVKMQPQI